VIRGDVGKKQKGNLDARGENKRRKGGTRRAIVRKVPRTEPKWGGRTRRATAKKKVHKDIRKGTSVHHALGSKGFKIDAGERTPPRNGWVSKPGTPTERKGKKKQNAPRREEIGGRRPSRIRRQRSSEDLGDADEREKSPSRKRKKYGSRDHKPVGCVRRKFNQRARRGRFNWEKR